MSNPNIAGLTYIYGNTAVTSSISTSAPGSNVAGAVPSNTVWKVASVTAANKTTSTVNCSLIFYRSSTSYYIAYQIAVPGNASIVLVGKDSMIYMNEGDYLYAYASTGTAIDVTVSYEAIS